MIGELFIITLGVLLGEYLYKQTQGQKPKTQEEPVERPKENPVIESILKTKVDGYNNTRAKLNFELPYASAGDNYGMRYDYGTNFWDKNYNAIDAVYQVDEERGRILSDTPFIISNRRFPGYMASHPLNIFTGDINPPNRKAHAVPNMYTLQRDYWFPYDEELRSRVHDLTERNVNQMIAGTRIRDGRNPFEIRMLKGANFSNPMSSTLDRPRYWQERYDLPRVYQEYGKGIAIKIDIPGGSSARFKRVNTMPVERFSVRNKYHTAQPNSKARQTRTMLKYQPTFRNIEGTEKMHNIISFQPKRIALQQYQLNKPREIREQGYKRNPTRSTRNIGLPQNTHITQTQKMRESLNTSKLQRWEAHNKLGVDYEGYMQRKPQNTLRNRPTGVPRLTRQGQERIPIEQSNTRNLSSIVFRKREKELYDSLNGGDGADTSPRALGGRFKLMPHDTQAVMHLRNKIPVVQPNNRISNRFINKFTTTGPLQGATNLQSYRKQRVEGLDNSKGRIRRRMTGREQFYITETMTPEIRKPIERSNFRNVPTGVSRVGLQRPNRQVSAGFSQFI